MIFLLTEQLMNGTVTMEIYSTEIESDSFKKAVEKIKKFDGFIGAEINEETDERFSFSIKEAFELPESKITINGHSRIQPKSFSLYMEEWKIKN